MPRKKKEVTTDAAKKEVSAVKSAEIKIIKYFALTL